MKCANEALENLEAALATAAKSAAEVNLSAEERIIYTKLVQELCQAIDAVERLRDGEDVPDSDDHG